MRKLAKAGSLATIRMPSMYAVPFFLPLPTLWPIPRKANRNEGRVVKKAVAIGLAGLLFATSPALAESDTANAIAGTIGAAAVSGAICWSLNQGVDEKYEDEEFEEDDFARPGFQVGVARVAGFQGFGGDVESDFQRSVDPGVSLDIDDTSGLGPENINIDEPAPGRYRIYIHYYGLTDEEAVPAG